VSGAGTIRIRCDNVAYPIPLSYLCVIIMVIIIIAIIIKSRIMEFIGREKEIEVLRRNGELSKTGARLTTVKGRRRVGKTRLIIEALGKGEDPFVYFFLGKQSEKYICEDLRRTFLNETGIDIGVYDHFDDAFRSVLEWSKSRHFTFVIDEIQNIRSVNPGFFEKMQRDWDLCANESKINLVVCGSVLTQMEEIFEHKDQPMYGRRNTGLEVAPFSIGQIRDTFLKYNPSGKPDDLLMFYAITGGVPKYMELLIDEGNLTVETMSKALFSTGSTFLSEGKDVLEDEFGKNSASYFSILSSIAGGKNRAPQMASDTGLDQVGSFLENLEKKFRIIKRVQPLLGKSEKDVRYELVDNFLSLWFAYIYKYPTFVESGRSDLLESIFREDYPRYSGRVLEKWFRDDMIQTGPYYDVGVFRGKNPSGISYDLDIVALRKKEALIAEVKRNREKISLEDALYNSGEFLRLSDPVKVKFASFSLDDILTPTSDLLENFSYEPIGDVTARLESKIEKERIRVKEQKARMKKERKEKE